MSGSPTAPWLIAQLAAAEIGRKALGHANRQETEVRLAEFQRLGMRAKRRLQLEEHFALGPRTGCRDQLLLDERRRIVPVEPAQRDGHGRFFVAVLVLEPFLLADAGLAFARSRNQCPRPWHEQTRSNGDDRDSGAGMAHPRQRAARGANERIEEWPRIIRAEMPAQPLDAIQDKRHLIAGQRHQLATRYVIGHGDALGRGVGIGPGSRIVV